jgi:CheY-like chemotaxis protein
VKSPPFEKREKWGVRRGGSRFAGGVPPELAQSANNIRKTRYVEPSTLLLLFSRLVKYVPQEILIADDNDITRGALRSYLVRHNLSVCGEAIDGKDAIEKALELNPALILLDLWMPQMNGVEVAFILRARMPDLRIILVTMFADAKMLESLKLKAGIDAVISKPDGLERLAECIRHLLALEERTDILSESKVTPPRV